jgi:hypothetical protein
VYSQAIRADWPVDEITAALDTLNVTKFSAPQLESALRLVGQLPIPAQGDPIARGEALEAYVRGAGFDDVVLASETLAARVTALTRWRADHDPLQQSNAQSVLEAAAVSRLSRVEDGIGFEPAAFQELILFIEEIPW